MKIIFSTQQHRATSYKAEARNKQIRDVITAMLQERQNRIVEYALRNVVSAADSNATLNAGQEQYAEKGN